MSTFCAELKYYANCVAISRICVKGYAQSIQKHFRHTSKYRIVNQMCATCQLCINSACSVRLTKVAPTSFQSLFTHCLFRDGPRHTQNPPRWLLASAVTADQWRLEAGDWLAASHWARLQSSCDTNTPHR